MQKKIIFREKNTKYAGVKDYTEQYLCRYQRHFVTRQNDTFSTTLQIHKLCVTLVCASWNIFRRTEFTNPSSRAVFRPHLFLGKHHAS